LHWQGSQYKVRSTDFQRLKNQGMPINPRKPAAGTSAREWDPALCQYAKHRRHLTGSTFLEVAQDAHAEGDRARAGKRVVENLLPPSGAARTGGGVQISC